MEENNTPIIYLEIDFDDMESGVSAISFVDAPATEIGWQTFSKQQVFEKKDVQRIITGPVMIAETPIYRYSPSVGPYYVKFSKKTIFDMMKKYFKDNRIHQINENHNSKAKVNDVYMVESFIIGERTQSESFSTLSDGTWMASFFVENEQYWNDVVMKGDFTGFSLEGMFSERHEMELVNEVYSKIESIIFSEESELEIIKQVKNILKLK
jgi:hypothetical protein